MSNNDNHIIRYSTGRATNFGKAKNRSDSWKVFRRQFIKPYRTMERFSAYLKLPQDEQVNLKSQAGWYYRTQIEGKKRKANTGKPTDIFTLDFDYATSEFMEELELGLVCPGLEFFVHSSRRHTDEKPRLRIIGIFARPVTNDEYGPVTRIIAKMFDPEMAMVDKVSFRRAQMMFYPTASKDGDYFYTHSRGELFDPDLILDEFEVLNGDWRVITNLPHVEGEEMREHADKAENPHDKPGLIGAFCRTYSIQDAIEKFDLPYDPVDDHSEKPRYTYRGGTTSSGAVVEDDGLFLFSHHGSDPCADMLVNAFDLVRIHKFGDLDDPNDRETPINKRESFKAVNDFLKDDPGTKKAMAAEKYDQLAMFDEVDAEYLEEAEEDELDDEIEDLIGEVPKTPRAAGSPAPVQRRKKTKPPKDWFPEQLDLGKHGDIIPNVQNAVTICTYDARLWEAIAMDEFRGLKVLRRTIQSKSDLLASVACKDEVKGDRWSDTHSHAVRMILAMSNGKGKSGYGLSKLSERDLSDAIFAVAFKNRFHPMKEYFDHCTKVVGWDGKERIARLFIDFLGCRDEPYYRETAMLIMVASVARIMEPGCKFDFAPVLQGAQGIRKSTFIEVLYGSRFYKELNHDLKDVQKTAENMSGVWGAELGELSALNKSDHNDAKQFMSNKTDTVRMAYAREPSEFPRQCVFWGTTNDNKYLKDPTGNRRWWPIIINVPVIDTVELEAVREQLWAEAFHVYRRMREETPEGDLPLFLHSRSAKDRALILQEGARTITMAETWTDKIQLWADEPVSLAQLKSEFGIERMPDPEEEEIMVRRNVFLRDHAREFALNFDRLSTSEQVSMNFEKALGHLTGWDREEAVRVCGRTQRHLGLAGKWFARKGVSEEEVKLGYTVIVEDDVEDLI
jgi:predicted P-loop ATPase